jgi:hypothetical protein
MSGRKVSRRDAAAGGIAMLVLAAAAAGQAKAEELDGELLALCREFHANRQEIDAIWDSYEEKPANNGDPRLNRDGDLCDRYLYIREKLAAMPARTPEGIRAKARVILYEFHGEDSEKYPGQYNPRGALVLSLARDLMGRACA